MNSSIKFLALVMVAAGLAACGGARPPDETVVVDAPPLLLPPDYELRPPLEGDAGPVPRRQRVDGRAILTGQTDEAVVTPDQPGWLLERQGVRVDPNIREELSRDAAAEAEAAAEKGWLTRQRERLLGSGDAE